MDKTAYKMKPKDAEVIVLGYLITWATLNTTTNEDFYNGFSKYYFPKDYKGEITTRGFTDIAENEHAPTDEEKELLRSAFEKIADMLIKKRQTIAK